MVYTASLLFLSGENISMKKYFCELYLALFFLTILSYSIYAVPCPQVELDFYTPSPLPVVNQHCMTSLTLFTCYDALAGYQFTFIYDPEFLELDTTIGLHGVTPAENGYLSSVDVSTPGLLVITGDNPEAEGTFATDFFLFIHWMTRKGGNTRINWTVDWAHAPGGTAYTDILMSNSGDMAILKPGDVNNDVNVNIVDALVIAQSAVGIDVSMYKAAADVNEDTIVNIVDALLVAQYTVGLQQELPIVTANPLSIPAARAAKLTLNFHYDNEQYRICKVLIPIPYYYIEDSCEIILEKGTPIILTAIENYLHETTPRCMVYFNHWEGDLNNTEVVDQNNATVVMNSDRTVNAFFTYKIME
jgi:hypothetical protein